MEVLITDDSTQSDPEPQLNANQGLNLYSYHSSLTVRREAICRNCHQAFESRNKLHKHIPACKHKRSGSAKDKQTSVTLGNPQPAVPSKLSELPTIQAPPPVDAKGHGFRTWHYAMVQAALSEGSPLTQIGADSGSTPTIIGRNWLKAQSFKGIEKQMDRPLHLTGLEAKPVATDHYVNLDLLIPGHRVSDGAPVKLALPVEAHVIPYLKAGALIGGDTLGHFGIILNFKERIMAIQDCDFKTPIKVLAKDHSQIKRVVTAKQATTVPAHSVMAVLINIRERNRIPEDRDFSFIPEFSSPQLGPGGGPYAHIIDRDADLIHVQNNSNQPYEIRRSTRLGLLTNCHEEGAYPITEYQHEMATTPTYWLEQDPSSDGITWQAASSSPAASIHTDIPSAAH